MWTALAVEDDEAMTEKGLADSKASLESLQLSILAQEHTSNLPQSPSLHPHGAYEDNEC